MSTPLIFAIGSLECEKEPVTGERRALSAGGARRQGGASVQLLLIAAATRDTPMNKPLFLLLLAAPAVAIAAPGGKIGTLQQGEYACELPGDAMGPAGYRQSGEGFTIVNSSSYAVEQGRGAYLLTGDVMTFTSGPRQGERYHRISTSFLRRMAADGSDTELRCVRRVVNNR